MNEYIMTSEQIDDYCRWLCEEERSVNTIAKYRRDLSRFCSFLNGRMVTKILANEWKTTLQASYEPTSVNSMLAAVNGFFLFMKWNSLRLKFLKIQRKIFRNQNKELNREEYERLLYTARSQGKTRLSLLLETVCGLGLRVSELKFITVDAVRKGQADVAMKGKLRTILIPNKLARKLLKYAKKSKISSGEIFITRNGNSMSRSQIWSEMKKLCGSANVERSKVFPHILRHLFARSFYKAHKDIVELADVLGHSSIETTRIYLVTTGEEHTRQLEKLGLIT